MMIQLLVTLSLILLEVSVCIGCKVVDVAMSQDTYCFLMDNNSVQCFGSEPSDWLGHGDDDNYQFPHVAIDSESVSFLPIDFGNNGVPIRLSAGKSFRCAILDNNEIKCWGNAEGEILGLANLQHPVGLYKDSVGDNFLSVAVNGIQNQALKAIEIVSGDSHSCIIQTEGKGVTCWGDNTSGQLGRPGPPGKSSAFPTKESVNLGTGLTPVQLALGKAHSCALFDNGKMKCWGANGVGELGLGDSIERGKTAVSMGDNLPFLDLGTDVVVSKITAGSQHTCALLTSSIIKCWGSNSHKQFGSFYESHVGDMEHHMGDRLYPPYFGEELVADVVAGDNHTCVLLSNDEVSCLGSNTYFESGDPTQINPITTRVQLKPGRKAIKVFASGQNSCVLLDDHSISCWGEIGTTAFMMSKTFDSFRVNCNNVGQCKDKVCPDNSKCETLPNSSWQCSCAVGSYPNGDVSSIGMPVPSNGTCITPLCSLPSAGVVALKATDNVLCGLTRGGQVSCWGSNENGAIGVERQGWKKASLRPLPRGGKALIGSGAEVAQQLAVGSQVCVIRSSEKLRRDKLECWGSLFQDYNKRTQVGLYENSMGDNLPLFQNIRPSGPISAGGPKPCAASISGNLVYCWDFSRRLVTWPPLHYLRNSIEVSQIAVSEHHNCIIQKQKGRVHCWGLNTRGVLGRGDLTTPSVKSNETEYVDLGTNRTATQLALGAQHTCVLLNDGNVVCWGDTRYLGIDSNNTAGQYIGDEEGEMGDNLKPVPLGSPAVRIAASSSHTCAVLANDRITCWGDNKSKQLGNGDVSYGTPRGEVANIANVVDLALGGNSQGYGFTCVLLSDGSTHCWGQNNFHFGTELGILNHEKPVALPMGCRCSTEEPETMFGACHLVTCSQHGVCNQGDCYGPHGSGTCSECEPNWTGENCDQCASGYDGVDCVWQESENNNTLFMAIIGVSVTAAVFGSLYYYKYTSTVDDRLPIAAEQYVDDLQVGQPIHNDLPEGQPVHINLPEGQPVHTDLPIAQRDSPLVELKVVPRRNVDKL